MRLNIPHFLTFTFSLLLSGCTSFNLTQATRFMNEDGETIYVEYGTGEDEHKTIFRSPYNGKEMEFKSKLRIRFTMPDGKERMAFQCMNELRQGTMYKTDDEEWAYQAKGFTCTVFRMDPAIGKYRVAFQGVVCQSPEKPHPEQRR